LGHQRWQVRDGHGVELVLNACWVLGKPGSLCHRESSDVGSTADTYADAGVVAQS
jgi:hypothetical protein